MKIRPSKHTIEAVNYKGVNSDIDIPLAYINTNTTEHVVKQLAIETDIKGDSKIEVIPYEEFDSMDVCLFDINGVEVENKAAILQRNTSGKYMYIPQDATVFYPQRFNYSVTGKKSLSYNSSTQYNFKVGCSSLPLANNLIRVFGDAPRRGIAPANVSVNNQDVSPLSLINSTILENDFVFIRTKDGENIYDGETLVGPVNVDQYLDSHTNIWLSIDYYKTQDSITIPTTPTTVKLKSPKIYSTNQYTDSATVKLPTDAGGYVYHNVYEIIMNQGPVVIMEKPNKGFVIISHKSFLDNIDKNVNLMYEILMYVYTITYLESNQINEWITDVIPDYVVSDGRLVKKDNFASYVSIPQMFGLSSNEISLVGINIDADNVKMNGITNNYILFKKLSSTEHVDPTKPVGSISIFTPRQNIMYHKNTIYKVQDLSEDKISWSFVDNKLNVLVKPFKHSRSGINITIDTALSIDLSITTNYKEVKIAEADIYLYSKENILKLIESSQRTGNDGILLAKISVGQTSSGISIVDIRQRGGGLPETEEPNYNLLDIGSIMGRPYRKSGTVIITLPEKLRDYEDLILKAIKRHMVAEELPIILFK